MVPTLAPTAVPTKRSSDKSDGSRESIFISAAKQRLLDVYNLQVESIPVSTFKMKEYKDLDKVDAIWPGSASAFEDFTIAQPGKNPGQRSGVSYVRAGLYAARFVPR